MATLQQLPTTYLVVNLVENPDAQTFPWNITGTSTDPTRSQIITELANRAEIDNVVFSPPISKVSPAAPPIASIKGKSAVK